MVPRSRWIALAGTACISCTALFVAFAGVSPVTAAFYRAAYAIPVLAVAWLFLRRRDPRPLRLRLGAGAAGGFLALDLILWHHSIELIGAGLATVVANAQVVVVGIFGWLAYRQRPTRTTFIYGSLTFLGLVLISGLGRDDAFGADPVLGTIFGLMSALAYAVFILGFQRSNPGGAAPASLALLDATIGVVVASSIAGVLGGELSLQPTWPAHGWLFALAMLGHAIGWTLIAHALPRLPALTVSVIILAQPMLAVLWGGIFLDERLSAVQGVGVMLVLVGMIAVNLQRSLVTVDVAEPALEPT